jgi:hypothetical protein
MARSETRGRSSISPVSTLFARWSALRHSRRAPTNHAARLRFNQAARGNNGSDVSHRNVEWTDMGFTVKRADTLGRSDGHRRACQFVATRAMNSRTFVLRFFVTQKSGHVGYINMQPARDPTPRRAGGEKALSRALARAVKPVTEQHSHPPGYRYPFRPSMLFSAGTRAAGSPISPAGRCAARAHPTARARGSRAA